MKGVRGNNIYIKERKLALRMLCEQLPPMLECSFIVWLKQHNDLEMFWWLVFDIVYGYYEDFNEEHHL